MDNDKSLNPLKVFGFTVLIMFIPTAILWIVTFFRIVNLSGISYGVYNQTYGNIAEILFIGMPLLGLICAGLISWLIAKLLRNYTTRSAVILSSTVTGGILVIVRVAVITLADLSKLV